MEFLITHFRENGKIKSSESAQTFTTRITEVSIAIIGIIVTVMTNALKGGKVESEDFFRAKLMIFIIVIAVIAMGSFLGFLVSLFKISKYRDMDDQRFEMLARELHKKSKN